MRSLSEDILSELVHTNPPLARSSSFEERRLLAGTDALPAFVRQFGPIPLVLVQWRCIL